MKERRTRTADAMAGFWTSVCSARALPYQIGRDLEIWSCVSPEGEIRTQINSLAPQRCNAEGPVGTNQHASAELITVHSATAQDLLTTAIACEGLKVWAMQPHKAPMTDAEVQTHFQRAQLTAAHLLAREAYQLFSGFLVNFDDQQRMESFTKHHLPHSCFNGAEEVRGPCLT